MLTVVLAWADVLYVVGPAHPSYIVRVVAGSLMSCACVCCQPVCLCSLRPQPASTLSNAHASTAMCCCIWHTNCTGAAGKQVIGLPLNRRKHAYEWCACSHPSPCCADCLECATPCLHALVCRVEW